ncbi:unnamed protein product [Ixodes hexagonus]
MSSKRQEQECHQEMTAKSSQRSNQRCSRCIGNHKAIRFKFRNAVCFSCSDKGHISKACRTRQKSQLQHHVDDAASPVKTEYDLLNISQVRSGYPKYVVTVDIGGERASMGVDLGAARSIISEKEFVDLQVAKRVQLEEPEL